MHLRSGMVWVQDDFLPLQSRILKRVLLGALTEGGDAGGGFMRQNTRRCRRHPKAVLRVGWVAGTRAWTATLV